MAAMAPAALAMQAAGSILGGIEQNRAARAGARVDDENARLSLLEGEQEADATRTQERAQAGEMLASMGGGGIDLGSGSAADMLAQSAYQGQLEQLNIRARAVRQANNYNQAATDKRRAGRAALIGGMFGAAASALQGAADMRARRVGEAAAAAHRAPRPTITGILRR